MSSLNKSSTTITDLYKGLEVITQLLKDISNVVKDDPSTNRKINEAITTFAKISSQTAEILSLVKDLDFSMLQSTVKNLQDHAFKQEEASDAWMKSSTNISWNLGSRITKVELSQTALKPPSGSVNPTLALTGIQANVEGENTNTTTTEEPPSHTEGKTEEPKLIATESDENLSNKLMLASNIIRPDPDEPVRVEFMINGKIVYLTEQEIQEY
ncbi:hypothetical protein Tco_0549132 [Tanacetum coccineum]